MNDPDTDGLLAALAELRRVQPSLRFGQLIASLAMVARGDTPGAVWEIEDDELAEAIRWQLGQLVPAVAEKAA